MKQKLTIMLFALVLSATAVAQDTMIVRLAEIEVYPEHLQRNTLSMPTRWTV